jgi:tetraacyldisaccharide 4'-kinase
MKKLRHLLWPFAVIYWLITALRNLLYDKGVFKQSRFDLPVIAIGNLNTGGTGKTPHVEYLIRILTETYQVAMLSRGYGRKTKGFCVVSENSTARDAGDEPLQVKRKFPQTGVGVCEDRETGIPLLLSEYPDTRLVLLDDAFQHRRVRAGLYILLTSFHDPFPQDFILPVGNLREDKRGCKRADIIVVTKCPMDITEKEKAEIKRLFELEPGQKLFLSRFQRGEPRTIDGNILPGTWKAEWKTRKLIIFSAIAGGTRWAKPYEGYFQQTADRITFRDHHRFSVYDVDILKRSLAKFGQDNCVVLTTEKDAMRLKGLTGDIPNIFYFPISVEMPEDAEAFLARISQYLDESRFRNATL